MMKVTFFCLLLIGTISIKAGTGPSKSVEEFDFNPKWTEQQINEEILRIKAKIQKMPLQNVLDFANEMYAKKLESEKEQNQDEQIHEPTEEEIAYANFKQRMLAGIIQTLLDQRKDANLIEEYVSKIQNEEFAKLFLAILKTNSNEFSTMKEEFSKQFSDQVQIVGLKGMKGSVKPRDPLAEGLQAVEQQGEEYSDNNNSLTDTVIISTSYQEAAAEESELAKLQKEFLNIRENQKTEIWRLNEQIENIKLEQNNPQCCTFSEKKLAVAQALKENLQQQLEQTEGSLAELDEQRNWAHEHKELYGKILQEKLDVRQQKDQELASQKGKLLEALKEVERQQAVLLKKNQDSKPVKLKLIQDSFEKGLAAGTFNLNAPHAEDNID